MATTYRQIIETNSGRVLIPKARWCNTFGSKLRGFTFRRHLGLREGLVLVENKDSRVNSAIHMLFVFFDLGVLWVNDAGQVVDKAVAQPWRLSYVPKAPARYVVEGHPTVLEKVNVGDQLSFQ